MGLSPRDKYNVWEKVKVELSFDEFLTKFTNSHNPHKKSVSGKVILLFFDGFYY